MTHGRTGAPDLIARPPAPSPTTLQLRDQGGGLPRETQTTIDQPVAEVAGYSIDPSNASAWYADIDSIEWQTEPPARVGSKVDFVARFLGRRLAYTYEFVELVPRERLVMRTARGSFPMETTYTWQVVGDGSTRMTLRNRGEPSEFSTLVAPVMALAICRANRQDLATTWPLCAGSPEAR